MTEAARWEGVRSSSRQGATTPPLVRDQHGPVGRDERCPPLALPVTAGPRRDPDPARAEPALARAHVLAGNVLLEVPGFVGVDRAKAEMHFKKALEVDPRFTAARVDLARLYIADTGYADARRELGRVTNETRPTIVADWAVKDVPRA